MNSRPDPQRIDLLIQDCTWRELAEFNGAMLKIKFARALLILTCLMPMWIMLTEQPADGHPVPKWPFFLMAGVLSVFAWAVPWIAATLPWLALRRKSIPACVSEDGVDIIREASSLSRPWAFYRRMKQTRNLYILFGPNPEKSFFIPKRAFSDEQQRERFVALVARRLP